jgi:hypothetical protein
MPRFDRRLSPVPRSLFAVLALGLSLVLFYVPAHAQFAEPGVQVLRSHAAEAAGDNFGWVAEAIGDLDGDGASEYIIGAILNTEGGPFAGKAYVYDGATGALIHTVVGHPLERLGFAVAGGDDLNGDGTPDYVIGAPGVGSNPSRVLVISGADHTVLHELTDSAFTFYGFDVGMAGDVDGDGLGDVVIGAAIAGPAFEGRVDVVSGVDGSVIWSTPGTVNRGFLGAGVSGLDDLDGDGVPEQGAGAPGGGLVTDGVTTGAAYILDGATGTPIRELTPNGSGGAFGQFFVHDAGDVDGDGVGDVYVGDFADAEAGGRGYVFSGANPGRIRLFNGETVNDGLGIGRGAGDIDGDGHADLLIGAYLSSAGAPQGGKCWVFSGKNGQPLRTFTSTVPNGQVGFDVTTLGDVDGDGWTDFLLTGLDVAFVVAGEAP